MQKGGKGGKKGGGKAAWDDAYGSQSGQSESPSRQNQTQSASVRGLDEDALRLSQPNLALPWAVLGLASAPKMYSEQGSRKATLKWLVHWVSCRSAASDWASGDRNMWQRSLGGNRNERCERFRTGIASLEVFASQGDRVPLSFLPERPGVLHVAKPFCICLAHRRPETEGSFAALCPEALDAVKRMKGCTVDASSATEYADKWKGLIETEAVASAVDEGLGRHLADTLVEWEHCSDGELLGKFEVKASLLFAHKIKFRSAMHHGEWASSWVCLRHQGRGEWFGHGAILRACFPEDDKDLLFAEEEEEWKDSTQNLQLTFRVIAGSSPHEPEDGFYTLELIQKALADSCMASALHELKACPLVQSLVVTGQPDPQPMPAPKVDLSVWGLNDSQLSAVTFALQNPFALVQGPPGTGKTMTTAVLATCFARQNMASGANRAVLLCTPTNRAADCAAAFVARICQKQAELRLHERSEVEGNVCAICLCSKPDMITLCSHAFHRQCLLQALDVGSFCPVCRQQVKHVDTGLRILRIYGADIEKQEFPVPKRNEHIGIDNRKPVQVPEDMRRFALHWRCHAAVEGEPASAAAERTRRAYSAMMKHGTGGPRFDQLRRNYQIALSEARAAELREADIVFTTCVSCRRMAVAQALAEEGAPVFWQVIVDEAGQATEPEALCPLTFAKSAQQICLFGDHQQLRPILKSQLTEGAGLAISLFERLVLQGNALQFLALQYRMNPGISWFPSHQFYGGRLLDDVLVQEQPPGLLEHPAQAKRSVPMFAWEVDAVGAASGERVSHTRTVDNSAGSRMHAGEAQSAARLAEQLAKIAGPASVGILCWYRAQVAAISEELCYPGIHVGSVATAQGSEWDYVLLSTVRRGGAAVKGRLGIVADPHILNVALTRARRGLVVLGHEATLSQDPNWKAFFDHCRQTDVKIQGPPLISTHPEILEESFARALVPGVKVEIQGLQSSPELNGKTGTIMTLANERGRWEVEVKKGSEARRLALKPANLSLLQVTKEPAEGSPQSKSLSGLKAIVTSDRPVDGVEFSKTWQVPTDRLRPKTKLALGEEVRIQTAAEGFEGALRSRGPDRSGCWTVEVSKHFCMQQGPVDVKVVKKGLEVSASGGMAHLLQQGKVVMLHGLKSQPKLNAEWGVVTSQAANEDGRWEVELVEFSPNVEVRRLLLKPENLAPEV